MTIPDCIDYLITKLFVILSSDIVWPFVGLWIAAYVIELVRQLLRINGRN